MKPDIHLHIFPSLDDASQKAAALIKNECRRCLQGKNFFTLVLPGGKTPRRLYEILTTPPFVSEIPWPSVHIFWGDERCVPPNHPESNYFLANELLLKKIALPKSNIHRIPTEEVSPTEGAQIYEEEIVHFFHAERLSFLENIPQFDFILLGVGTDGHTASLFPESPLLNERHKLVAAEEKPSGFPEIARVTFTLPLLNHGKRILFLAGGHEKMGIIRQIQESGEVGRLVYPAAMVVPSGRLDWFVSP